MADPALPSHDAHSETEALLPWYATGELDGSDRARVEQHLALCAHCQRQLAIERRVAEEVQAFLPEVDTGWLRLRERIAVPDAPRPNRIRRTAAEIGALLRRPAIAVLAAAQIAMLLLAVAIAPTLSRPEYQALGSAGPAPAANVIVMFRPDASEREIRAALRTSGASLVGGPTSADAYLLSVPADGRASALAKLRADKDVTMAEPIDSPQ
jgi:anti-sigma factor RsiW